MSTAADVAKQVVEDKIHSQVKTVEAKLETLRAKAESAKANTEIKAIAALITKTRDVAKKLIELRMSQNAYQQVKSDIESRVAELENSVHQIEAKFKAA